MRGKLHRCGFFSEANMPQLGKECISHRRKSSFTPAQFARQPLSKGGQSVVPVMNNANG